MILRNFVDTLQCRPSNALKSNYFPSLNTSFLRYFLHCIRTFVISIVFLYGERRVISSVSVLDVSNVYIVAKNVDRLIKDRLIRPTILAYPFSLIPAIALCSPLCYILQTFLRIMLPCFNTY